jgi:hypothetical protein
MYIGVAKLQQIVSPKLFRTAEINLHLRLRFLIFLFGDGESGSHDSEDSAFENGSSTSATLQNNILNVS